VTGLCNQQAETALADVKSRVRDKSILVSRPWKGGLHDADEIERRQFVLRIVQPGLEGLMDGSVSTLAPLFAAAFATYSTWNTFEVGLAASLGARISMSFAKALSDDGVLTGRGAPLIRGIVCGAMTAIGGLGHTLLSAAVKPVATYEQLPRGQSSLASTSILSPGLELKSAVVRGPKAPFGPHTAGFAPSAACLRTLNAQQIGCAWRWDTRPAHR
jgi:hypothetical protein